MTPSTGLGFPLLADPDHAVAEAYGVWGEKSLYGRKYMGIVRSAFLIGEDGRIVGGFVRPKDIAEGPNPVPKAWLMVEAPRKVGLAALQLADATALQPVPRSQLAAFT